MKLEELKLGGIVKHIKNGRIGIVKSYLDSGVVAVVVDDSDTLGWYIGHLEPISIQDLILKEKIESKQVKTPYSCFKDVPKVEFKRATEFPNLDKITKELLEETKRKIKQVKNNYIASGKTTEMLRNVGNLTIFKPENILEIPRSKATIVVGIEYVEQVNSLIPYFRAIHGIDWVRENGHCLTKGNWEILFLPLKDKQGTFRSIQGRNIVALFIEHTVLENQIKRAMTLLLEDTKGIVTFNDVKDSIASIRGRISTRLG